MAATVLPLTDEIDPATFLPSSRSVAFPKAVWALAGGYPEWLDYCEDLLFDFGINRQAPALVSIRPETAPVYSTDASPGSGFIFAPDAIAISAPDDVEGLLDPVLSLRPG